MKYATTTITRKKVSLLLASMLTSLVLSRGDMADMGDLFGQRVSAPAASGF
jgi:hypothetical protein